jgi:hypothetical protein
MLTCEHAKCKVLNLALCDGTASEKWHNGPKDLIKSDGRFGSIATLWAGSGHFRSFPNNGLRPAGPFSPVRANSGHDGV